MANHSLRRFVVGLGAGALGAAIFASGCQQAPVADQLPGANFNGPLVQAPPAPPPQPVESQPKVQPKPAAPVTPQPKPTPQLTGIPRDWIPPVKANEWKWIVIHHSATPAGGAKAFDKMHKQKGWDELGYHFVIGNGTDTADGQIEVGPRWTKQKHGAHAKTPDNQFNEHGIGICLVGNFDTERPTRAQIAALAKLTAYLMKTYHVSPNNVMGHEDTGKATDCPGKFMDVAAIRRQASALAGIDNPEGLARTAGGEMLKNR
jgi:N-acetylmuramoyl-L-alanine amidase